VKGGDWYQHLLSAREKKLITITRRKGSEYGKKEEKYMMCTYLRSKLDHRSARPRKIKYEGYKV
jgi:hypothetical protein